MSSLATSPVPAATTPADAAHQRDLGGAAPEAPDPEEGKLCIPAEAPGAAGWDSFTLPA
ncbi:hypothetical protein GCM10009589_17640 [Arthrobacter pascens]